MARMVWRARSSVASTASRSDPIRMMGAACMAISAAGAKGDACIGLRQAGRIVHAVADHGHHRDLLLQIADRGDLLFGQRVGTSPERSSVRMTRSFRPAIRSAAPALIRSPNARAPLTSPSQPYKATV